MGKPKYQDNDLTLVSKMTNIKEIIITQDNCQTYNKTCFMRSPIIKTRLDILGIGQSQTKPVEEHYSRQEGLETRVAGVQPNNTQQRPTSLWDEEIVQSQEKS